MVESFDYASVGSPWYQKECYRTDSDPWAFVLHLSCPIIPRAPQGPSRKVLLPKRLWTAWTVSRLLPKWDRPRRQQLNRTQQDATAYFGKQPAVYVRPQPTGRPRTHSLGHRTATPRAPQRATDSGSE